MGVKQYGSALGHKIIIALYKILGYKIVSFILNFVAFYYAIFTPSVKKSLESYYEKLGIKLTFWVYFKHIRSFSHSIFDRFVSRISPGEITFTRENREAFVSMQEGGVALLSHVGGWATAAHSLNAEIPPMHMVMKEAQQEKVKRLEREKERANEAAVKIIDLSDGAIAANIQIANVLMKKEIVAMMADRVADTSKTLEVEFFSSKVEINRNPFDIAWRFKKKLIVTFAVSEKQKEYKMIFREIEIKNKSLEEIGQEYMNILEEIIKMYPNQWYNFYDFFNQNR